MVEQAERICVGSVGADRWSQVTGAVLCWYLRPREGLDAVAVAQKRASGEYFLHLSAGDRFEGKENTYVVTEPGTYGKQSHHPDGYP